MTMQLDHSVKQTVKHPRNFTEAKAILNRPANRKGFAENTLVWLDYRALSSSRSTGRNHLPVHGGTFMNPVRIVVASGWNTVEVLSGHVEIQSDSASGNMVNVHLGATAVVSAYSDRKLHLSGDGDVSFRTDNLTNRMYDGTTHGLSAMDIVDRWEI